MVRVERGNTVLYVEDYELQHYLQMGYNQTNELGMVITSSIPQNVSELQKAYVDNKAKIEQLEDTIAKLTAELSQKKIAYEEPTDKRTRKRKE